MSRWYDRFRIKRHLRRLERTKANLAQRDTEMLQRFLLQPMLSPAEMSEIKGLSNVRFGDGDASSARETKPQIPHDAPCRDAAQTA